MFEVGACWAWLLVGACCAWPVAGVWLPVCAWVGWEVEAPLEDPGAVVCACGEDVEVLGEVVVEADGVEADGVWVVVVSGDFWVAGDEVVGVWVCWVVGAGVVELGDWANAAVANTRPTAVLIRKRVFILEFLRLRSA